MSRADDRNKMINPERVLVLVTRDMSEVTSKIVFRHEAAILEEIHGEGTVELVADPMAHEIFIGTPEEIEERREFEKQEMDATPGFMATIKVDKYRERPTNVAQEMERLRVVYGRHMTKDEFVADVVYPNARLLLMEVGEVAPPATEPATEKVKRAA